MTTASSCCAASRQTSQPECSTRSGANRSHSYLPPERLPLAAAFAGFRTNVGYLAIHGLQKRSRYLPLTTPQIAACFFRSGRLAFPRTSGIPKPSHGRFCTCCKPRMDTHLFFSLPTRIPECTDHNAGDPCSGLAAYELRAGEKSIPGISAARGKNGLFFV